MDNQYSPSGFSFLPIVVKNLLIINGIMFLADIVLTRFGIDLNSMLGLHFFLASGFRPYQLLTYMFMHGNFSHLFFNMFALWMFGNVLENIWGAKRFLMYYIICGLGAAVMQEGVQYIEYVTQLSHYQNVNMGSTIIPMSEYLNYMTTVGASGAIYGLLLAFGMMFPNSLIYLYFVMPIKAKWFVIGYAVIELLTGVFSSGDQVAHFAHLGGMLVGLIIILIWKKKGRLY
ncbi:MAG: rhomboid family intramembrane serine protease [Bacteroidales bacterium]|nr:rhomboid family intramembrane serine protease [Bacteroidales bacterium]